MGIISLWIKSLGTIQVFCPQYPLGQYLNGYIKILIEFSFGVFDIASCVFCSTFHPTKKNRFGTEINSIGTIVSGFSGSRSMLLIKVIEKIYPLEKPKSEKYQVRI